MKRYNVQMIDGFVSSDWWKKIMEFYEIELFGHTFEVIQQGLALLALIPIWLYRGKQGFHGKVFQYFCYAFYPVHMLILFIVRELWLL